MTDVLCFALFTAATLSQTQDENKALSGVALSPEGTDLLLQGGGSDSAEDDDDEDRAQCARAVVLRNRCLKLFFSLLYTGKKIFTKYAEDVVQVVGFDWILLFMQVRLARRYICKATKLGSVLVIFRLLFYDTRNYTRTTLPYHY